MIESENDAIVQVRENQRELLEDLRITGRSTPRSDEVESPPEKNGGRIEQRSATICTDTRFIEPQWRKLIVCLIVITRVVGRRNKGQWQQSQETACYISTARLGAAQALKAIRGHWQIENSNNFVRDVALKEDASGQKKKPGVFAKLRSNALNILRVNQVRDISDEIYRNTLNFGNVLNYLGIS